MAKRTSLLSRYRRALHDDAFGGLVLMVAALVALLWANSPWRGTYFTITQAELPIRALALNLTVAEWASDALLAIFFFTVGLELKEEFTIGSLRDPKKAALPILAAATGMAGPVLVYVVTQLYAGPAGNMGGAAVPVATDIAFALGVLGIFGKGLPPAARVFLMTLAVADDLSGIIVIAVMFTNGLEWGWLAAAILAIVVFYLACRYRADRWWVLWPLGILAWYFMFRSGIHATIAAVALGLTAPTRPRKGETTSVSHRLTQATGFWSAGVVLPVFAFFAAGVSVVDSGGIGEILVSPVTMGIYLGLPVGKCLGIWGGTALFTKVFRLKLDRTLNLADIFVIGIVGGIGFTVSLLLAQLSFPAGTALEADARLGVLMGTLLSTIVGGIALRLRVHYQRRGLEPDE